MDASRRDQGLHRVSRATRWVVAGGIALSGALTAVVAKAAPGHKSSTATTPAAPSSSDSSTSSSSSTGLQPPSQAPLPGLGSGSVRSGAS
jgi:hypothetical protein